MNSGSNNLHLLNIFILIFFNEQRKEHQFRRKIYCLFFLTNFFNLSLLNAMNPFVGSDISNIQLRTYIDNLKMYFQLVLF